MYPTLLWFVTFSFYPRRATQCRHVTKIPSPQLLLFSSLTNRDARNSFRIRSYTNCRVPSFDPKVFPDGAADSCLKSHGIISFSAPLPLTLLESCRFKDRVGGLEASPHPVIPLTHLKSALPGSLPFYTRISHPNPFRINTFISVDPTQLKVVLKSTLMKNRGRGGQLSLTRSVNQKRNKGFLFRATPAVRGADPVGPSAVGRPVPNRTDDYGLPDVYSRCAILAFLRSGDRPFLPPRRPV
jgi:hypothetical protein